jgi:hypothetical protein
MVPTRRELAETVRSLRDRLVGREGAKLPPLRRDYCARMRLIENPLNGRVTVAPAGTSPSRAEGEGFEPSTRLNDV